MTTPTPDPERTTAAPERATAAPTNTPASAPESADEVTVYVRRKRTPTLAFWVLMLMLAALAAGAIFAVWRGASSLGAVVNTALLAVIVIGLPLSVVAAVIEMFVQRSRGNHEE